jgi:hypothetical protein
MPDAPGRVTPIAISSTTTLVTRTGSWKYIRPIYQDRVAPCLEACPVGIDIEGYLNLRPAGAREPDARRYRARLPPSLRDLLQPKTVR